MKNTVKEKRVTEENELLFLAEEVEKVFKNLKCNKAPEYDNITNNQEKFGYR